MKFPAILDGTNFQLDIYLRHERLPFEWNFRKFRREFKWNSSSRWNVFGKKVIPFEVFPFSRFDRNARKFLYHLSTIYTGARGNRPFHLFFNRNNPFFWQMVRHIAIFFFICRKHSHRKFFHHFRVEMCS